MTKKATKQPKVRIKETGEVKDVHSITFGEDGIRYVKVKNLYEYPDVDAVTPVPSDSVEFVTDTSDKVSDCCGDGVDYVDKEYHPGSITLCKSCGEPCEAISPAEAEVNKSRQEWEERQQNIDDLLDNPCGEPCEAVEPTDKPDIKSDCCEAPIKEDIKTKDMLGHEVHHAVLYCTGCGDKCGIKTKDVDTDRMKEVFDKKRELEENQRIEPIEGMADTREGIDKQHHDKIKEIIDWINNHG